MSGWYDGVFGPDDIQDWQSDRGQIREQCRFRHELDAGGNILGSCLLQLEPDVLHRQDGALVLPGAALVEDACDRPPAELLAGGDPAQEEPAKQERADMRHSQQASRQTLLSLEATAGKGANQDDRLHKLGEMDRDQHRYEAPGRVSDQSDGSPPEVPPDSAGIGCRNRLGPQGLARFGELPGMVSRQCISSTVGPADSLRRIGAPEGRGHNHPVDQDIILIQLSFSDPLSGW